DIMARYFGLLDRLNTFLKELSHPYRNWAFIVKENRILCLDYFYLLKEHPQGHRAAHIYVNIFIDAIKLSDNAEVRADAADNLLLFLQKLTKDSEKYFPKFKPVINGAFDSILNLDDVSCVFPAFCTQLLSAKKISSIAFKHR
ncbi:MAG: hypothetical protein JRJ27_16860, partial [Deltaproteobacteria bacterium]|nr:hypothetical protein [Deltaproteobacteria bacterium]